LHFQSSAPPFLQTNISWSHEPGYSKTAIVNAVTRAAHTEAWRSWTTSEDLERAAGEPLYARVWNAQMP